MRKTGMIYATALALGSLMPNVGGLEAYAQDDKPKDETNYSAPADMPASAGKSSGLEKKADSGATAKAEKKKGPVYEFIPGKTRAEDEVRVYVSGDEAKKVVEETKGMKGISYDSKGGYILITPEAKKDGTYGIFRDAAISEKIGADGKITDEEIEYATKYSPGIFNGVFDNKMKTEGKNAEKKEPNPENKDVRYEDLGPFGKFLVDSWKSYHKSKFDDGFNFEDLDSSPLINAIGDRFGWPKVPSDKKKDKK
jgi:hypothetical protein